MNTKIIIKTMGLMFVCLLYTGCDSWFRSNPKDPKDILKQNILQKAPKTLEEVRKKYIVDIEQDKIQIKEIINEYEARIKTLADDAIVRDTNKVTVVHTKQIRKARNADDQEYCYEYINSTRIPHCTARKLYEKLNQMKLLCQNIQLIINQENHNADHIHEIIASIIILKSQIICAEKVMPYTEKIDEKILSRILSYESILSDESFYSASYYANFYTNEALDEIIEKSLLLAQLLLVELKEITLDVVSDPQLQANIQKSINNEINNNEVKNLYIF